MSNMDSPLLDGVQENNSKSSKSSEQVTLELPTSEGYRSLYLEVHSELLEHKDFIVGSLKDKYQSLSNEEIYSDYVRSITDHFKRCPGCSEKTVIAGEDGLVSDLKWLLKRVEEEQQNSFLLRTRILEKNVDTDQLTIEDFIEEYYWYYFRAPIGRFGELLYCQNVYQKAQFIVDILAMSNILQDHQKIIQFIKEYGNDYR